MDKRKPVIIAGTKAKLLATAYGAEGKQRLQAKGSVYGLLEGMDTRIIQSGTGRHKKKWELWGVKR